MVGLKKLLDNQWFFPIVMSYYGIMYIFFGEPYYMNDGLSMDGVVFSSFIPEYKRSFFFDTYYIHRVFPSVIVGVFFKYLPISVSNHHVFIAFQILNLISIALTCYFFKKLLILFKISFKNQLLAFTLLLINFAILKFPFYLSVMTDSVALVLSTMLLYYYIKRNTIGVVICTIIASFTWPLSFYQGLIFIIFPFSTLPFYSLKNVYKITLKVISALFVVFICVYLTYIKKMDTSIELVARINKTLLPLSIIGLACIYVFFALIFFNNNLFNIKLMVKKMKLINIMLACGVVALTLFIVYIHNPPPNKFYPLLYTLSNPFTHALMWPLHTIVSHAAFWGVLMILLMFFWTDFCKIISQMGWGLVLAFALNLYSFGIMPETRCLVNLLPWIAIFLIKAMNKYSYTNVFYITVGILCFVASKIWLVLNERGNNYYMQLDKNGSMGFPDQKMWMNVGPWMSEAMYYLQGEILLIFAGILFVMLYKFKRNTSNKIKLVRRSGS